MEFIYLILVFCTGGLAGLYASTVGGGLLLTFPVLILIGLPIDIAIATNRFSVIFLNLSSSIRFLEAKLIDLKFAIPMGLIASLGAFIGSNLVINIDHKVLEIIVIIFLTISIFLFLFKDKLHPQKRLNTKKNIIAGIIIFLLGIYGGFFGAALGTVFMFLLVFLGFKLLNSAANSRVIGLIMSLSATAVFAYSGLIDYKFGLILGFGYAIGAWFGAGFGIHRGKKIIKPLFILISAITILKLLFVDIL